MDPSLGLGSLRSTAPRVPPPPAPSDPRPPGAGPSGPSRLLAPPPPGAPGTVLERVEVSADVMVLRVGKPTGFRFTPGQYAKLGIDRQRNKYSIASAPGQPWLEFCIERVPGGALTPRLFTLRRGDRVELANNGAGSFCLEGGARRHLLVATVTGVAPFISMLRHHLPRGEGSFLLLHGARHPEELAYRPLCEKLAADHPDRFAYIPTVTRPGAESGPRAGRVTAWLDEVVTRLGLEPGRGCAYACGHPDMVREVGETLRDRSIRVRTESYW